MYIYSYSYPGTKDNSIKILQSLASAGNRTCCMSCPNPRTSQDFSDSLARPISNFSSTFLTVLSARLKTPRLAAALLWPLPPTHATVHTNSHLMSKPPLKTNKSFWC